MRTVDEKSGGVSPSREAIVEAVRQIVVEQMSWTGDPIGEQDSLEKDIGCDSLDLVEIMMGTEERFDIRVPDEAAEGLDTVGDIADRIRRLLAGTSAERV